MPPTERKGRVHTSTVTVAVIDPTENKLEFQDSDFTIEWFSGTGAGGQNRNKVKNSCRMTHLPTGLTATAQTRDRNNSLKMATDALTQKVTDYYRSKHFSGIANERKNQVGSGQRGDKIRTIRFQDDTATDHRNGKRTTSKKYLQGYMDLLWD